jgi:hypothetical protein
MRYGQKMIFTLDDEISGHKVLIHDICIVGHSLTLNFYRDKR